MSLNMDEQEALRLHNEARREIKEDKRPDLVWDPTLAASALEYAQKLAQRNKMVHSSNSSRTINGVILGENLAFQSGGSFSLAQASKAWINEKYRYRGEKIGSGGDSAWGHYTEIIWPEVTRVGIASARARSGATYVVGRYNTCQVAGQKPYSSVRNNFKNRVWEPIGGTSNSSRHDGSRRRQDSQRPGPSRNDRREHGGSSGQVRAEGGGLNSLVDDLLGALEPQRQQATSSGSGRNQSRTQARVVGMGDLANLLKGFQDQQRRR